MGTSPTQRSGNGLQLAYLPEPETHPLWTEIKALLAQATDDDANVYDGELVWIAFEGRTLFGVATTLLLGKEARILACAGFEHRRWLKEADALVTRWARDCGAHKITVRGRKGWARYFRAFGWAVSKSGDRFDYEKVLIDG